MFVRVGDEVLKFEHVETENQVARVGTHYAWAIHIRAELTAGILRSEYRRPVIEGTEWQGQIATDEQRPMFLQVDDSEPIKIPVVDGIAEAPLEFEAPGTYRLTVSADFPCEPAELEVVI